MTKATEIITDSFDLQSIDSFSLPHGHSRQQPLHRHPDTVEMLLVLEGNVQCTIDGKLYTAVSGSVLTIPAGTWHRQWYAAPEQQSGYKLAFSAAVPFVWPPVFSIKDPKGLKALLVRLQKESVQPQADSKQLTHHLIGLLFTLLSRSLNSDTSPTYRNFEKTVQEIKHYIEENHPLQLTLDLIAERFSFNKYQLARLFKEYTGISPIQYIISCRLDAAKQLLATTDTPVNSIAAAVGYKSDTQFQAAFKKAFGVTPRQYRLTRRL